VMQSLAAALAAVGMTSATLGLAIAPSAAPTGPSQVEQTTRTLEASGYHVIVNRSVSAPLKSCTVSAVGQGQQHTAADSRGGSSPASTESSRIVYLDVSC